MNDCPSSTNHPQYTSNHPQSVGDVEVCQQASTPSRAKDSSGGLRSLTSPLPTERRSSEGRIQPGYDFRETKSTSPRLVPGRFPVVVVTDMMVLGPMPRESVYREFSCCSAWSPFREDLCGLCRSLGHILPRPYTERAISRSRESTLPRFSFQASSFVPVCRQT